MRWRAIFSTGPMTKAIRFLMKVAVPTPAENPSAADANFNGTLQDLFRHLGALATYSRVEDGRRVDYALLALEPAQITPAAERVFRLLQVKPEFLPEVVPQPYYGRSGY